MSTSFDLFFILGCQRSGTTLTRLVLDSHSKIHCFDEYKSYKILHDDNVLKKEIEKYSGKKLFGFKTPAYTEQMNNPMLREMVNNTITKNRFHDSKMIFLYRDVRDVISSMKSYVQKEGSSWLERWVLPSIEFWEKNFSEFSDMYKHDLEIIRHSQNKAIASAALYWKVKNNSMIYYENLGISITKVRYEDLVHNSSHIIQTILNYLDLEWEDNLLQHNEISHDEINQDGLTVGKNDPTKPIHSDSIGRYRHDLSPQEQNEIMKITSDLMSNLGYSL